jgi:hypothetical protein
MDLKWEDRSEAIGRDFHYAKTARREYTIITQRDMGDDEKYHDFWSIWVVTDDDADQARHMGLWTKLEDAKAICQDYESRKSQEE